MLKIEAPARLGSGIHGINKFGCFSYYGEHFDARFVESIGRFTIIGNNVTIGSHEHCTHALSAHPMFFWPSGQFPSFHHIDNKEVCAENIRLHQQYKHTTTENTGVIIGNDVWICNNAIILNGVTVGDGAVIAAGSVVTKDVEPYSIVSGIPAKVIRKRFSDSQIASLLELQWWNYGPDILNGIYLGDIDLAIDRIRERIEAGFPLYKSKSWVIDVKNSTLTAED